jgi:hypothetical protein
MSTKLTKLVPFVDNVGRIIIGRADPKGPSKTATSLQVKNPAIVNIQMQDDGQVSVQLIPYMFREFMTEESQESATWEFKLDTITFSRDVILDDRINEQYRQIFELTDEERADLIKNMQSDEAAAGAAGPTGASTVQLFDENAKAPST